MTGKNRILNTLEKYLLAGSILVGTAYDSANAQYKDSLLNPLQKIFSQPKDSPKLFGSFNKKKEDLKVKETPDFIYSEGELTSAGNGVFLTSYVYPSGDDNSDYNLRKMFSSKNKISYSAITSKEVKKIVDNSSLSRPVKETVMSLQRKVKENSSEEHRKFNNAIRDGILTQEEMENIGEGVYAYRIQTNEQSVVGFIGIRSKKESLEGCIESEKVRSIKPLGNLKSYTLESGQNKALNAVIIAGQDSLQAVAVATDSSMHPNAQDTSYSSQRDTSLAAEDSLAVPDQRRLRLGISASAGEKQEVLVGAFARHLIFPWMDVEVSADYFINNGYYIARRENTEIKDREVKLIGPATYKKRTDEITAYSRKSPEARVGIGTIIKISDEDIGISLNAAAELYTHDIAKTGKSTVEFERNNLPLQEPSTIENTINEKPSSGWEFAPSAGIVYNINKNLSLEALLNAGLRSSGRLKINWEF